MNRRGNYSFCFTLLWPCFMVHRGVVEGGKKLSPTARERFWERHSLNEKREIDFSATNVVPGKSLDISVCMDVLQMMKERNLVIVCNACRPKVWTPARIKKLGRRVDGLDSASASGGASGVFVRCGGLELGQLESWRVEDLDRYGPKSRRWLLNHRRYVGG